MISSIIVVCFTPNRLLAFKLVFFLCLCLASQIAIGQDSKREATTRFNAIYYLDTNEIKAGKHLEHALEFSIEDFILWQMEHGKTEDLKRYGPIEITAYFTDTVYTYIVRKCTKNAGGILDFIKVKEKDIEDMPINHLDSDAIRKKFHDRIIPEADKRKVEKREKLYSGISYSPRYKYKYQKGSKEILVSLKWKITGNFGIRIINKTYHGVYDIVRGEFKTN